MAQAAGRIAQFEGSDADDEDTTELLRGKKKGKKSGSLMVGTESVEHTIDWPHMHVRRMVSGKRKNLAYSELKMEEFVFWFLAMLKSPKCKMDKDMMLDLLQMLMQDTMDYSWCNARNFYENLGIDVEMGEMKWSDESRITQQCMAYSRAVFPEKKETKEGARPTPRQAPAGMKCCAPFQNRSCEQTRDHPPYTHACSYCFKSCSLMCRHAETDCIRKLADDSKNGKKREA